MLDNVWTASASRQQSPISLMWSPARHLQQIPLLLVQQALLLVIAAVPPRRLRVLY